MVGGSIPAEPQGLNHYDRLGLTPAATAEDLRQAFRTLSKRFHPDTTTLPAATAAESFRAVQQAYALLADPQRRRAYDEGLQADRRRPSLTTAAPGVPLAAPPARPGVRAQAVPVATSIRRALSGGEWLALLLLAIAMVLSLVLGLGLAWARGAALVRVPSWWSSTPASQSGELLSAGPPDGRASSSADAALSPSSAKPGILAGEPGSPAAASPFPPLDPGAARVERGDRAQAG